MSGREGWLAVQGAGAVAVLLIACSSPNSGAVDERLAAIIDDDPIELLDTSDPAGVKTRKGKPKHDPVVFVHGCPMPEHLGSRTNYVTSKYWRPIYEELRGRGYPAAEWSDPDVIPGTDGADLAALGGGRYTEPAADQYLNVFVFQGAPCGPNGPHAEQLAEYVEQVRQTTGSPRVDIVANSLGAIPARLYVQKHGAKRVRDFAILAGVNHGTDMAVVPTVPIPGSPFAPGDHGAYDGARDLFPAYACQGEAPNDHQFMLNGCLRPDQRVVVDETPYDVYEGGGIAYLSIYNVAVDELVNPTFSACLNQEFRGDCTDYRVNLPIQVLAQSAHDLDTPHGSIRADAQALCPTVEFVMCRNKAQREPCDVVALSATGPAQATSHESGEPVCAGP